MLGADLRRLDLHPARCVTEAEEAGQTLPAWYMIEVVRDLPRLVEQRQAKVD